MKIKTNDFLKGLKLILDARVGPLEKRLARVEAENAALHQELKALREHKAEDLTPAQMSVRYSALQ